MEENKNVESKKKSPVGIIILVIILMIGCLIGGYFISEKGLIKNNKNDIEQTTETDSEEVKEAEVTNYDVTDTKVAKLIDNLLSLGVGNCGTIERYANDKEFKATDLTGLDVYHIVEKEFYNKKDSFTLDEFNTAIKKYLYGDIKFDVDNINFQASSCPQFKYDSGTKTFTKQETACGGTCGPDSTYKMVKAVDTDGTLEIEAKVIFAKDDHETFYSDYQKTNEIGKFDGTNLDALKDKGSNYKFIFKLVDGNYAFVSSEPVK